MLDISDLDLTKKKYIIFDMDGTLIDSIGVWNIAGQGLIHRFSDVRLGLDEIQQERDHFLNTNHSADSYLAYCEYLIHKYKFTLKDASKALKIMWAMSDQYLECEMDYKPNAVSLITALKDKGYSVSLATMTTQTQLDIYTKRNKRMMSQMNIEEIFDFIMRKEDGEKKKQKQEGERKGREHVKARREECLVIEDSYTGVLASKNAGIEVVNIYDKHADIDREKIDALADYKIKDYREFLELLEQTTPRPTEKKLLLK